MLSLTLVPALAGCTYLDQRMADLHDAFVYRFHDDVLGVADIVTGLPSLDDVKGEILALIDAITAHLNSLKPA